MPKQQDNYQEPYKFTCKDCEHYRQYRDFDNVSYGLCDFKDYLVGAFERLCSKADVEPAKAAASEVRYSRSDEPCRGETVGDLFHRHRRKHRNKF